MVFQILVRLAVRSGARWFLARLVGDKALAQQPEQIHLTRQENHTWANPDAVAALTNPLLALGFVEVGVYTIPEMPAIALRLFARPQESLSASVYEHQTAGVWMDYFSRYQDGTGMTLTTAKNRGLDQRPGHPVLYAPDLDARALYLRALSERPQGARVCLTAEQLPGYFEKSYAESALWRKNKGISGLEVANVARSKQA